MDKEVLYNNVKKLQKQANQRISRLSNKFGEDTWATKILKNKLATEKLQAWSQSGRIKVNKKMTIEQLENIQKFTENFLSSRTSKISEINKIRKKQIEDIKENINENLDSEKFSYSDAEFFYSNMYEKENSWIYKYITPSKFEDIASEGINRKAEKNDWIDLLWRYSNAEPDTQTREKAGELYDKFIEPYI